MKKQNGYAGSVSNCGAQVVTAPLAKKGKKAKSTVKRDGDGRK